MRSELDRRYATCWTGHRAGRAVVIEATARPRDLANFPATLPRYALLRAQAEAEAIVAGDETVYLRDPPDVRKPRARPSRRVESQGRTVVGPPA